MLKKITLFFIFFIFLPHIVAADNIYLFEFELNQDNTVDFISLQKSEGTVTIDKEGSYAVILTDEADKELWRTEFPASFIIMTSPPHTLDSITLTVKLPRDPSARSIKVLVGNEIIFSRPISSFCDMDGACDENENFFNCPVDCKSGSADGVCDSVSDGRCDPDCSASGDPDCTEAEKTEEGICGPSIILLFALLPFTFPFFKKGIN